MNATTELIKLETGASTEAPHLSHSRINRYLTCPEQYRLYYIEGLRPRVSSANLLFGQAIHLSLSELFRTKTDATQFFNDVWGQAKGLQLRFSGRDTWESLQAKGELLLEKFQTEELSRVGNVRGSEKPFELSLSNLDVPFIGVIDLLADVDGKSTVVDFKTSSSSYQGFEVILSDQLTAYQLAEPEAERMALCVFVKTKEPRIEWDFAERNGHRLAEFLAKARIVGQAIGKGQFYKRPGKHCAMCDFQPVCLEDREQVEAMLWR